MALKESESSDYSCSTYPIATFMFFLYTFAFVLAVVSGGILIEASMSPLVGITTFDELDNIEHRVVGMGPDYEDLKFLYLTSLVIGGLSIVFSLVFLWLAVDLGIILFHGRKRSRTSYERFVKNQMRAVVGEKTLVHRKK